MIASAFDTALLASSTAAWISAMQVRRRRRGRRRRHRRLAVAVGQAGSASSSMRDEAGDEGLLVADDHALADQRVRAQPVLEHGRRDVLAAGGDDELLLAAGDAQEAVVVELADVAGVEPAVARAPRRWPSSLLSVAAEDVAALDQDLAVVGDADRARRGAAGRRVPILMRVRAVDGRARRSSR